MIEGSVQTTADEFSKMKIVDENCGLVIVLLLLLRTGSKSKQEPQIDWRWRSSGPRVRVKERTSWSLRMPKMPNRFVMDDSQMSPSLDVQSVAPSEGAIQH